VAIMTGWTAATSSRGGSQAVTRATRVVLLGLAAFLGLADAALAQSTGRIVGRVISQETGEPISGAHVSVEGTSLATLTNMDGRYMIQNVEAGAHALLVRVIGFGSKTVTGVQVEAGGVAVLDVSMSPRALELDGITVSATVERGSTTALLAERRKSAAVVDAVGSEQISRSPDGDAAAVLARAPGVSVVDNKYVLVRGLGDRYGAASLNGAPMASPEPDKKTVPLDIVPSSFLESVVTAKTYSPDQPGDYTGGLVQIRTRNFPSQRIIKLGASASYNPAVTFANGLGYAGGGLDFLAMDDGTRALPDILPNERVTAAYFTPAELEQYGEAFLGTWGPTARELPLARGFNVAVGDEASWFDDRVPVGYLVAVTQSASSGNKADLVERVVGGGEQLEVDYGGVASTRSASLGGMANFSIEPTPANRFTISGIYNRNADDESRILQGYNHDFSTNQRNYRIRYLEQELVSGQLKGEQELGFMGDTRVDWRMDVSKAGRYEPNTREVLYRQAPDGRYLFETFVQSGSVFHSDLNENGYGGAVDVRVPFQVRGLPAMFSLGGSASYKDREAYARRFRFLPQAALSAETRELGPNELFSPATVGPDAFEIAEATFPGDNYVADQGITAGYAMVDAEVLPRLRFVGGARVERATQTVTPLQRFLTTVEELGEANLEDTDVLPGVNLTYELSRTMNLRAGVSRTLARPQFRELAPFQFTDYAGGFLTIGNPALQRSRVSNYDLRWEWYPQLGALVAVSGFYKDFESPIETVVLSSTELLQTWVNADGAQNFGAELEIRSPLGFIHGLLNPLSVNANVTYVESEVTTSDARVYLPFGAGLTELGMADRSRPLQGQSPYVVNLGLNYTSGRTGTLVTVLYNHFGRRIDNVGSLLLPDIYEEDRGQLDLVLEQPFGRGLSAKLSAQRLVGSTVEFTQGGESVRRYDLGQEVSLSVSWDLGG
jgi:outer membrane receptor protein involved in Fe transport